MEGVNVEVEEIKISHYDSPWEVACSIINAQYKCENIFGQIIEKPFFEPDELRRIGEHIVNYCKTEEERKRNEN